MGLCLLGLPKTEISPTRRPIEYTTMALHGNERYTKIRTKLIETSSADFYRSDIKETLKQLLLDAGVTLHERTDVELYGMVLPEGSKQEKAFIRLIATFVTLLKSSCRSLSEVQNQADEAEDQHSEFVIKTSFGPFTNVFRSIAQKRADDFTDAILQATELCRISHPVSYDYISSMNFRIFPSIAITF